MNPNLKDRLVIITGASSGIGEKMAYEVAKSGGHLILLARRKARLAEIAKAIEERYNVRCHYYELDVRHLGNVEQTFQHILNEHDRIDVLVNNAGFGLFRSFEEASLDEMEAMFEVNVYGMMACTKYVLQKMLNQQSGHIINIASQAGKMATPKSSLYAATKHAVLGFTNSLRLEVADRSVFVTAVNPGPIQTEFFDVADTSGQYVQNVQKWMLRAEDVAEKVVRIMLTNKRELNFPWWMETGSIVYRIMPNVFERLAKKAFHKK
ncbi:SDR family oxidoreductase [Bacillus sp. FJAT-47783]|uniref:SDR family NAD(P)-dependent oxidoreductase n=1 Tax=Bacillus sp. FJAT-47783 TaxID=2922712 RepID=UPI001FAD622D|nr:SDR family oxidoreductase [Bacillus sp. FJAT-47783]